MEAAEGGTEGAAAPTQTKRVLLLCHGLLALALLVGSLYFNHGRKERAPGIFLTFANEICIIGSRGGDMLSLQHSAVIYCI